MAVTKPKGSGIETPTSEPGFCMTDFYDSECDDELDEYYNTRHQRRLSDPSSNLNNFSKNGWKQKQPNQSGYGNNKAMSQNEGLDSLANEISEIEAGDVRDGEASSIFAFLSFVVACTSPHLFLVVLGAASGSVHNHTHLAFFESCNLFFVLAFPY